MSGRGTLGVAAESEDEGMEEEDENEGGDFGVLALRGLRI